MTLIGEATLDSPILADALETVPEMVLHLEEIRTPAADVQFLMWAEAGDFPSFEAAISTDSTIASYRMLTDLGDRRLYRFTLSSEGETFSTYPTAAAEDIVVLELTLTADGIRVLVRLPSRKSLAAYARACDEHDVPLQIQRLYMEEEMENDGGGIRQFGITDAQREALLRALEMGYFDTPRRTSLEEIADELGVSGQALSTRLRRGQTNLIETLLA